MWKMHDTITEEEGLADTPEEVGTLLREWFSNAPDDIKTMVGLTIATIEQRLRDGENIDRFAAYLGVKVEVM